MNETAFFARVATGAPIVINCGFVPAAVTVVNLTDANKTSLTWFRGMADDSAIKSGASRSVITTLGITPNGASAGSAVAKGVTIGADATVNVNGNNLLIRCERGGEGNQF